MQTYMIAKHLVVTRLYIKIVIENDKLAIENKIVKYKNRLIWRYDTRVHVDGSSIDVQAPSLNTVNSQDPTSHATRAHDRYRTST